MSPLSANQRMAFTNLVHRGALWPLAPASIGMAALSALRNHCFDHGWRRSQRLPVPVISVGNIVAGGSGKTPLVAWLLEVLRQAGHQPAVIARGYKSAHGVNDEARMLGAGVYCNPRRTRAGMAAIAEGANCLIMDDGLQHRQCHRDLDLLCIDGSRPWGWPGTRWGVALPWGLLRESAHALRRVHGVVLTRYDQSDPQLRAHVRALCAARGLPLWRCCHGPVGLRRLHGNPLSEPHHALSQRPWFLVSAIARPQAFAQTVRDAGATIRGHCQFPDHHHFTPPQVAAIARRAKAAGADLLCTAKDAVKIAPLLAALDQPAESSWWCLDVQLTFIDQDGDSLGSWLLHHLNRVSGLADKKSVL